MKKTSVVVFNLLLSHAVWALDCDIPPNISIHHTEKMYANSVLWLNNNSDENIPPFILKSAQDKNTLTLSPTFAHSSIQKLQPEHPFKTKQNYTLKLKELSGIWQEPDDPNFQNSTGIWFNQDALNFKISQSIQSPALAWQQYPKLKEVEYNHRLHYGNSGGFSLTFKVNQAPENYLIAVHISKNKHFSLTQSFLKNAQQQADGTHEIYLGFGLCEGGIDDFHFNYADKIAVKFDLISHDGIIRPWQGEPLLFSLRNTKSTLAPEKQHESTETSFFQTIKTWLIDLFKKLFS